jgi:hypothetical protein
MTLIRIINVRVDTTLEDILEMFWLGVFAVCQTSKMDVKEGGTVMRSDMIDKLTRFEQ